MPANTGTSEDLADNRTFTAETVNSYFSKTGYRSESGWQRAVKLVETVAKDLDTV